MALPAIDFKQDANRSFFLSAISVLDWIVHTCNGVCIICDRPLDYVGLRPSLCNRALCNFSYEQYGLGSDLASEVRYNPELIDLLITFAASSMQGHNREVGFDPFPEGVRVKTGPKHEIEHSFLNNKAKDFDRLAAAIKSFPPVADMSRHAQSEATLREFLEGRDVLSFALLRWLVSSNRAHMQFLPPDKQIKGMGTPYQFLMLSNAPEKEGKFRESKRKYGSQYMFHGSSAWNWHSILRVGLKNFSNTSRMTAGAALGPGIYLAQQSNISQGYMGVGQGWENSAFGDSNLQCIVMAEVIKKKEYDKGGHVWVCPEEDDVVTRYFFVYTSKGGAMSGSFDSKSLTPPTNDYFQ